MAFVLQAIGAYKLYCTCLKNKKGKVKKMSTKVIDHSENLTAREILKITSRSDATVLKDVETGTVVPYVGFVKQEILNEVTGEKFTSIVVVSEPDESGERKLYATRSESFIKAIDNILDVLADNNDTDPFSIRISHLKSKNGREFVTCSLA